jgi:hypothetical protein
MPIVKNTFIAKFKIGDNIHYNLDILKVLYSSINLVNEEQKRHLEKPITVILVSICEAIIYDFIERSKSFSREGVNGLSDKTLSDLKDRNTHNFDKKIKLFKELNLLQTSEANVYEYLKNLSLLRNRVHIQNEHGNFELDDADAFTRERRLAAEVMLEIEDLHLRMMNPAP